MLDGVKHVIPVLSGKGGVGKSTVAVQLALALQQKGFKVGLLDVDLCGPTVPHFLGLEGSQIHQSPEGWVPVYVDQSKTLSVISIGFLLRNKNDAVIWRGPKKTGMIRQFLTDVSWEDRDFLIIDTPPGTSDEHITVMEHIRELCDGAVIVTTPQAVSLEDVRKEITFCRRTKIPILGLIENMSGYVCSNCSECTNIFSSGGGQSLSEYANVPFLGSIPIDPKVSGKNMLQSFPDSSVATSFNEITNKIISGLIVSS